MKIVLAGGGTGGPVAPLLAVAGGIKSQHPNAGMFFIGTKRGPEKRMAQNAGLEFASIPAGKLRRYFSWRNFGTPFLFFAGFIKSLYLLKKYKADCIFGTGGYVQVPVVWAGWVLGIPSLIHQQDVVPSLANTLCQFPAKKITVTFESTAKHFLSGLGLFLKKASHEKILVTGNPVRQELLSATKEEAVRFFNLSADLPVLYVVGGGTGSLFLNQLVKDAQPKLKKVVQVIHSAGVAGRGRLGLKNQTNYQVYDFIDKAGLAYAAADIVLSRAGLSTISELSLLRKTSIVVPLPNTHQEYNAYFLDKTQAALVLPQEYLSADALVYVVRKLLFKYEMQKTMQNNIFKIMPHDATARISKLVSELAEKHHAK
ncbi:MAG: undecaprenyldiphospho-muramoylpentapeptide beta-N-acetylglucosaminyltransferase [Patescibacteria group bacterium]|nr:undecaprenyldiphospho-muramoylpentapeptide beta-N-acetylglucosaminyltransferase [Patescibacteria group bacterium]